MYIVNEQLFVYKAVIVYRLIEAALIGIFWMIPSYFKIEILAIRSMAYLNYGSVCNILNFG